MAIYKQRKSIIVILLEIREIEEKNNGNIQKKVITKKIVYAPSATLKSKPSSKPLPILVPLL